jgi:hypothetical protein
MKYRLLLPVDSPPTQTADEEYSVSEGDDEGADGAGVDEGADDVAPLGQKVRVAPLRKHDK